MRETEGGGKKPVLDHASFIWQIADLLRGDYKPSEYGKVILPLTVLRRGHDTGALRTVLGG